MPRLYVVTGVREGAQQEAAERGRLAAFDRYATRGQDFVKKPTPSPKGIKGQITRIVAWQAIETTKKEFRESGYTHLSVKKWKRRA